MADRRRAIPPSLRRHQTLQPRAGRIEYGAEAAAVGRDGSVDVLVNNAGIGSGSRHPWQSPLQAGHCR
jgi:NAD(P)-dependent dehydrogenase (short-subunit alcohol dehydrogenase family)